MGLKLFQGWSSGEAVGASSYGSGVEQLPEPSKFNTAPQPTVNGFGSLMEAITGSLGDQVLGRISLHPSETR